MQHIPWWKCIFDERDVDYVSHAILGKRISQGKETEAFESELAAILNVKYVVATSSGSTALLSALLAKNISYGDEVIVPNRTWIATPNAVTMTGAKPVFVDVLPNSPLIDTGQIESKLTTRTKAILPVHLNGRSANMVEVQKIASKYNLAVIEDAAQAFMCTSEQNSYLGTLSDIGCFSMSISKLISSGQGGFCVTSDERIYQRLKRIRSQGVNSVINVEYEDFGFNFKFTDIQAAVARCQLSQIENKIEKIKNVYRAYEERLKDIEYVELHKSKYLDGEIPIYVEISVSNRDAVVDYLQENGVQTRPMYPNLEKAKHFSDKSSYPNSDFFQNTVLVLPSGPDQSIGDIETVCDLLESFPRHTKG